MKAVHTPKGTTEARGIVKQMGLSLEWKDVDGENEVMNVQDEVKHAG